MYERNKVPVNFNFTFADEVKTAIELTTWFDWADDEYNIEMMYISLLLTFDKDFDSKLRIKEYVEDNANGCGTYVIGDPYPQQYVIKHYFEDVEAQLMKFFYDTFEQYVRLEISTLRPNSFIASAVILKEQFDKLDK